MKESDQQFWSEHISSWKRSKLSIRKHCEREGLIQHRFYRWKKDLAGNTSSSFIEAVDKDQAQKSFSLKLSNGMSLSFDTLPDAAWLGNFIRECSSDSQSR